MDFLKRVFLLLSGLIHINAQVNYYGQPYGYQTYDLRLIKNYGQHGVSYQPRSANPYSYSEPIGQPYHGAVTYRNLKPTYDFISKPTYDYSINYGHQPAKVNTYRNGQNYPVVNNGYGQKTNYHHGYTPSTGGYSHGYGYHGKGYYGYQTRNVYPAAPVGYGNIRHFGKSGPDSQEEYEFTDVEDFRLKRSSNKDQNLDVSGFSRSYSPDVASRFGFDAQENDRRGKGNNFDKPPVFDYEPSFQNRPHAKHPYDHGVSYTNDFEKADKAQNQNGIVPFSRNYQKSGPFSRNTNTFKRQESPSPQDQMSYFSNKRQSYDETDSYDNPVDNDLYPIDYTDNKQSYGRYEDDYTAKQNEVQTEYDYKLEENQAQEETGLTFIRARSTVDDNKNYDPCEDLEEGDYTISGAFSTFYPGVDPQCNFVKCASLKAYLIPCSTGAKNSDQGDAHPDRGYCGYRDFHTYCGYAVLYDKKDPDIMDQQDF